MVLSHKLAQRLAYVRKQGILPYLRPDGKSQVTVEYDNGVPVRVDSVVIAAQHDESILDKTGHHITKAARQELIDTVARHVVPAQYIDRNTKFYVNETGKFVVGGPQSDTGMTGRKIIVDTYGGRIAHGGGAFSGKDPSKVDRSAAYAARYVAKNIVAAGLAKQCQIQVAYAIGVAKPMNVTVYTEGTGVIPDNQIAKIVGEVFDLRPKGIIQMLDLLRPIYEKTAAYGHFGRDEPEFSWERTDKVAVLRDLAGLK